jgi:hypothetical protein
LDGRVGAEHAGHHRHHHQCQHTGQVFHDQPADRDLAAHGFQQAAFLHGPQQHHGTGGGQRETEDDAMDGGPAHQPGYPPAEQGRHGDLADGTGDGDRLDRHQVLQREVQADAEHQQHHAQFGQLVGQRMVGDASNQITDQWRQAELVGQRAEDEGEPQANSHDVDQVGVMVHRLSQKSGGAPIFTDEARYGKPAGHVPWPAGLPTHFSSTPAFGAPLQQEGAFLQARRGVAGQRPALPLTRCT